MEKIKAIVENIVYYNDKNYYSVVRALKEDNTRFTAVGIIYGLEVGKFYEFYGDWEFNNKYGEQFSSKKALPINLFSKESLVLYLSSGRIKGVRESIANRIIQFFGDNTLDILDNEISRLKEINGIGDKLTEKIKNSWEKEKQQRSILIFLSNLKISLNFSDKIIKTLGEENVINTITENPYILSEIVEGIGFKRADSIAKEIGIKKNSIFRIKAGIKYILSNLTSKGNVCIVKEKLIDETEKILVINIDKIQKVLNNQIKAGIFKKVIYDNTEYIYLYILYRYEKNIAEKVNDLLNSEKLYKKIFLNKKDLDIFIGNKKYIFSDKEEKILENIGKSRISIITGGPGTGKTTIIKVVKELYKGKLKLAAPTGRAAKRLEEATNHPSSTIHRLLEYNPSTKKFKKNIFNPFEDSLIIIDESSMIDIYIAYCLLDSVGKNSRIVFVGDSNQLPSIGPGNFFRDILSFEKIPKTVLKKIHRQDEKGDIVSAAYKILNGEKPKFSIGKEGEIYFIEQEDPEKIKSTVYKLFSKNIPEFIKCDPLKDIQIITPLNKGQLGSIELNKIIAEKYNPSDSNRPAVNDKIIQLRNNYDKDIYNGDIGIIKNISSDSTTISFISKTVNLNFEELKEVTLAYSITIHKSQGSEYKAVIILLHPLHFVMLERSLLYTAVTRGKNLVVIIGTKKALYIALNNNSPPKRYSLLKYRLSGEIK